jgi:hypothetical protein
MRTDKRRVGLLTLVLAAVAAGGAVLAAVQEGKWAGTTDQGLPFSVETLGSNVVKMEFSYATNCASGSVKVTGNIPINASNFFSYYGGFCPDHTVSGTFNPSAGTATGTLKLSYTYIPGVCQCTGTATRSWSATFGGVTPTPTPTPSPSPTPVVRAQSEWHSWFAVDTLETPYAGDFNGDGRTDIITFTRQNPSAIGDVYVALSEGTRFGANTKWHDWFAITTDETVVIGDYNGDGKDDIATWLGKTSKQVYVALSKGTGMDPESVWLGSIGADPSDVLLSGDANADGKRDLICFARKQGKVYVALSDGTKFATPTVWHNFFAVSTYERPRVADANGDGRADIVTFATDSPTAQGDVYVATSDGSQFVDAGGLPNSSTKWHDWFAVQSSEEVRIGDLNGDAKDDFFTFLPLPWGQAYSVNSLGTSMAPNVLWPQIVIYDAKDKAFVGDVNGDGRADIIIFAQGQGKVYVSLGS